MGAPGSRARYRPVTQNRPGLLVPVSRPPRAAESPVFCLFAQISPHWIAFHVPQHGIKVIVLFNRKRFEASLVEMPRPFRVVMSMPPHHGV